MHDNNSLAHKLELQISYRICAEVQKESILRTIQSRSRKDTQRVM